MQWLTKQSLQQPSFFEFFVRVILVRGGGLTPKAARGGGPLYEALCPCDNCNVRRLMTKVTVSPLSLSTWTAVA